jgi:tetratricopeptide (TPR) repeat protein
LNIERQPQTCGYLLRPIKDYIVKLAVSNNLKLMIIRFPALIILVIILFASAIIHIPAAAQTAEIDSLKKVLKEETEDSVRVMLMQRIGWRLYARSEYTAALDYADKAIQIAKRNKDKAAIAKSYSIRGEVFFDQGNYTEAMKNHLKALKLREEIQNKKAIAASLHNIAHIHQYQNSHSEALINYLEALKLKEEASDQRDIAMTINNLANVYLHFGMLDTALFYHKKNLKIREEIDDKKGIAASLHNVGIVLEQKGNLKEAIQYYIASYHLEKEYGDVWGLTDSYNIIGRSLVLSGKPAEGKKWLENGLNTSLESSIPERAKEAHYYLMQADSALARNTSSEILKKTLWQSSFDHFDKYIHYKDSLQNEENTKLLVKQQMQYEFDKKEAVLKEKAAADALLASEEKKKKKILILLLSAIGLSVALISAIIYRSLKITRNQKEIIETQKQLVEEKQKEILDSIYYARRIQQSMLPTEKYIEKHLNQLKQNAS